MRKRRKRHLHVHAVYHELLVAGVDEDSALITAVRGAYSKKRRHSDEWCLWWGRWVLSRFEHEAPP